MSWQVVGTRERRYRVDTPLEVSAWVDDEIATIKAGWLPLASEREADGSLRVLYGGLPPALSDGEPDETGASGATATRGYPILHTPTDAGRGAVVLVILGLCLFVATLAGFVWPSS